jgi:ubiquinone/menaquinone biosynthesis C-methylase UbiE
MRIETYRGRLQDAEVASGYADRFQRGSRRRIDRREQRAVRRIFARLPDCGSVLDVPAGAGRFLPVLASGGRWVIEADVAMEILRIAQERAADQAHRCAWLRADAARLGLRDECVDCVFSNRLLHHVLDREQRAMILREFCRVARRYAVVSFFDYHAFGRLRRLLKALKGRKPKYERQPTLGEFKAEVVACGFRVRELVPTGPVWVAQKYLVLEKP